jgi:hypothetical protein
MSSIANLFSNLNDLVKPKSVTDSASDYNKNDSNPISLSLNQGSKFNKYQKKITDKLKNNARVLSGVEGFQTNQNNIQFNNLKENKLTRQSVDLLKKTNVSQNTQQTISELQANYASTMTQYENLLATVTSGTTDYINRTNPNNPYLGKNIGFTTGNICYVTQQGVVKWYPNWDLYTSTAGFNGCPSSSQVMQIDLPWLPEYNTAGTIIPTNPPLVSGTPMTTGQSCGNEGSNVFVNTMISNPTTSYQGCYADNASPPSTMTFIGGSPPPPNTAAIVNGNFTASQIAANTYIGYWGTNNVPGWYFNAMLLNNYKNSSYPIPYPGGNQCVSIYYNQYIYQLINLQSGTYSLSFYLCGSNIGSGGNEIGLGIGSTSSPQTQENQNFYQTPPVDVWTQYTVNFTITTAGPFQITFWGFNDGLYSGLANVSLTSGGSSTSAGTYTYSMCEQAAITGGYNFFALQNVNTTTSQGYCAVSNDGIAPTQNGTAYVASGQIALWSSNTAGNPGAYASFVNGSLKVLNSSGAAIFSTPNDNTAPSNYIGCYGDTQDPAALPTFYNNASQEYNNSECQQIAQEQGATYYGLQNSTSGTTAQCTLGSDLSQAQQYGVATNCTQISDGSWSGGGWSNALYSTSTPTNSYYLILQDDGNMCIYLGSGPNDNQGGIWCAMTNGQQQQGNPLMVAANNKFGQIWMPSGSALAPGEYLSYTNGNLVLIMQSDGNLVLYTYQLTENCQQMADGNTGGGVGANALYALNEVGVSTNMSQLAYIDQNSELHPYPSTNTTYTNTYATMSGVDSSGYDIPNAAYGNATVAQCQTSCNSNSDCAGFAFSSNTCYPKTSSMYPAGEMEINPNVDLYIRNQIPQTPPVGVSSNTNNIDTVLYQNYVNGGAIGQSYGLANASSAQQQQLQQLQTNLNLLSNQINGLTNQFETGNQQLEQQSQANSQGLTNYINDIEKTNKKIKTFNTNVDNVLQDSDIIVLKQNYDYLFWSILAVTTVIISMNIIKK